MEKNIKVRCINPSKTLTKGKLYLAKFSNRYILSWENSNVAQSYVIINDNGVTINIVRTRFEEVNI